MEACFAHAKGIFKDRGHSLPHIDGGFRERLVAVYTTDETMGTEWYPGDPAILDVQNRVNAADIKDIRKAKEDFNVQQVRPGDVLVLKGTGASGSRLLHSSPHPKPGVLRIARLYGT